MFILVAGAAFLKNGHVALCTNIDFLQLGCWAKRCRNLRRYRAVPGLPPGPFPNHLSLSLSLSLSLFLRASRAAFAPHVALARFQLIFAGFWSGHTTPPFGGAIETRPKRAKCDCSSSTVTRCVLAKSHRCAVGGQAFGRPPAGQWRWCPTGLGGGISFC